MIIVKEEENKMEAFMKISKDFNEAMENFTMELMKVLTPAIKNLTEVMREGSKEKESIDIEDLKFIEDENGET